jgi:hypothetical protein
MAHVESAPVKQLGVVRLDSFTGATDDDKLTAALAYVTQQTHQPAVQLPGREVTFTQQRTPFSGLRILGAAGRGPKNLELAGGKYVPAKVTLNTGGPWWTGTGTYYDIYIADAAFQYGSGASFWAQPSGTLYSCEFASLTHYGAAGVFGSAGAKALMTQVIFSGHWTVLGCTDIPFHIGGSDNNLWTAGYLNIQGPSAVGGNGRPLVWCDWMQKTNVANVYATAVNGWRGVKVDGGAGGYGLNFTGCRTEGANDGNRCDGNAFLVHGGGVSIRDHWAANAMAAPASSEHGVVEVTGGDVAIDRICYNHGGTPATVPLVYCSGGTVRIAAAASSTGEPLYVKAAGGTVTTDSSVTTG